LTLSSQLLAKAEPDLFLREDLESFFMTSYLFQTALISSR
jgi:hypothetical protein